MIHVTVWNEFDSERTKPEAAAMYPNGIHAAIAEFLAKEDDFEVRTAVLDDPECGITDEMLEWTDVLIWWGHHKHKLVPDELAAKVQEAVLKGMGMIFLHSAHGSKPFKRLMGTACNLIWREDGDKERLWVSAPAHPIVRGLPAYIELPHEETYGEPFGIPEPDETLMLGWYEGGEVFRSACTFHRGYGRIFYFQPGHETYGSFYDANVQLIIRNAIRWASPEIYTDNLKCPHVTKIEG